MTLIFDNYTVISDKGFEAAVPDVWCRAEANGFTVLYFHDFQTILKAEGFQHEPAGVIEICYEPGQGGAGISQCLATQANRRVDVEVRVYG